ncbi:VirB3 family type IV secretion system protein [Streptobacillus moniliformis]|uniref:VirB3 family type IV secretion system protein n=1 Tax=Streptobacillus moniliformis TaxID=34105 RepID=UPI0007E4B8B2|nr:VirB3 family type IV secretion system protein [Streptobacillus moniliformis]QXW66311.1 VirB3 family type IV secretion system protein [Streptobacillus moniliformis]
MKKLPVYKGIMESKTSFGVPISAYIYLGTFSLLLYIFLRTFLIIIPVGILFTVLKIVSRKDSKFLHVFFINLFHGNFYGF